MKIGSRIHAPQGCAFMPAGMEFYLLSSTTDPCRVLIVRFDVIEGAGGKIPRRAYVMQIQRDPFERACATGLVQETTEQPDYPPWLTQRLTPSEYLARHPEAERYLQARMALIQSAIDAWDAILIARRPTSALATLAQKMKTNVTRHRVLVLSYMIFGCNPLVLLPLHQNAGHWDRTAKGAAQKFGRPSLAFGKDYGANLTKADQQKIVDSYRKNRELGLPLTEVYVRSLKRDWKCTVCTDSKGRRRLVQLEGHAIPTLEQYRRVLKKLLGKRQLELDRRGYEWVRNRRDGNRGSFIERCANLYERVELDAFTCRELPETIDGQDLPPLYVVRVRDSACGAFVGIGFSLGSETLRAYKMAAFCMAISKQRFCLLFGLVIAEGDWPMEGLVDRAILDRGVGSYLDLDAPVKELAKSYSGQGKAIIESSHPKEDHPEGAPSYVRSGKTPIELAVACIVDTIDANRSIDVSKRLSPQMRVDCERATPLAVYDFLSARGRDASTRIPFDVAVRKFLPHQPVTCTPDGVELLGTLYTSAELRGSDLLARAKRRVFEVEAYVLPFCVRHIWIDVAGRLMELELVLPLADRDEQRNLSLGDLEILRSLDARRASLARAERPANKVGSAELYEETTGMPLRSDRRRPGRPKPRRESAVAAARWYGEAGNHS